MELEEESVPVSERYVKTCLLRWWVSEWVREGEQQWVGGAVGVQCLHANRRYLRKIERQRGEGHVALLPKQHMDGRSRGWTLHSLQGTLQC